MTPYADLYSGQIIVRNMSGKFQIVYLCGLKAFIMRISCYVSALICNENDRGVKNCFVSRVAKLIISTVCRVADMLYSMS